MKKRILLVLTLLIAFFGFMGLSISNKQVEVYAETSVSYEVSHDLNAIHIPSKALLSFPVTYQSVYGNDISWSVDKIEDVDGHEVNKEEYPIIQYDDEAHWMVVSRHQTNEYKVTVTVTVTNKNDQNDSDSKSQVITVPAGVTETRSYSINYNFGCEDESIKADKEFIYTYKLGNPTYELPVLTRDGYDFQGWYLGETKYEKILVGTMFNFVDNSQNNGEDNRLVAKWAPKTLDYITVNKLEGAKTEYNAFEEFDPSNFQVIAHYTDSSTSVVTDGYTFDKTDLVWDDTKVIVTFNDKTAEIEVTVNPISLTNESITINNVDDQVYTGSDIEPNVTIKYNEITLTNNDYDLTYSNNKNVSGENNAVITISGKGNFTGSVEKTFKIVQADIANAVFDEIDDQPYTGSKIEPSVTGTFNEIELTSSDYETIYGDNIQIGEHTITINGIGNFKGTTTLKFNIVQSTLDNAVISFEEAVYSGSKITPVMTVKFGDETLNKDQDYTVEFGEYINAGSYDITIYAKDGSNYEGSKTVTFDIIQKTLEVSMFATIDDQTYNGSQYTPVISGTYNNISLEEGEDKDFVVSYVDNINAGTGTVLVSASDNGNFTGSVELTFVIVELALSEDMFNSIESVNYTGQQHEPEVSIAENSLVTKTDFTVSYSDNINAGQGTVKITAKEGSNFKDSVTLKFTIEKLSLSDSMFNSIESVNYSGQQHEPEVSIVENSLVTKEDFTVSYGVNINAGQGTVIVTANENSNFKDSVTLTFTIEKLALSDSMFNQIDSIVYTGSQLTPEVTIVEGSLLTSADYTLAYGENINVGTESGTVVISATKDGNFTGEIILYFDIIEENFVRVEATLTELHEKYDSILSGTITDKLPQLMVYSETNKTNIAWTSNTTGVSVDENGNVTVDLIENSYEVELYVEVSAGNAVIVDTFDFKIPAQSNTSDENSKVTVEGVQEGAQVVVDQTDESESNYEVVGEDEAVIAGYEITLQRNDHAVQPMDVVTVKLPVPAGYNQDTLKVYYVNGENQTDMNAYVDETGEYLVFTTTHFSKYIVVGEPEEQQEPQPNETTGTIVFKGTGTGSDSTTGVSAVETKHMTEDTVYNAYVNSISANGKVYAGKQSLGLKFGSSDVAGLITITLKENVKASSVKLITSIYGSDNTVITVNGAQSQDGIYVFSEPTSEIIITAKNNKENRFYLTSIEFTFILTDDDTLIPDPIVPDVTEYDVNLENDDNMGTANLTLTKVAEGKTTTLTVEPKTGYKVVSILVNQEENYVEGQKEYTFTINKNTDIVITYQSVTSGDPDDDNSQSQPTTVTFKISDYATANGWTDATQHLNISIDEVITATASNGQNNGKYYNSGTNWRLYQSESGTVSFSSKEGYTIISVKITYAVSNNGVLVLNNTEITSNTVVDVNANIITFAVGNTGSKTNGQVRITDIEVIYQKN